MVYDDENGLLFNLHKGEKLYVEGAYWWSGFDEFNEVNVYRDVFKNYDTKVKKLNISKFKALYIRKKGKRINKNGQVIEPDWEVLKSSRPVFDYFIPASQKLERRMGKMKDWIKRIQEREVQKNNKK